MKFSMGIFSVYIVTLFNLPAYAFDTKWHQDATEAATSKLASEDAVAVMKTTNYLTDFYSAIAPLVKKKESEVDGQVHDVDDEIDHRSSFGGFAGLQKLNSIARTLEISTGNMAANISKIMSKISLRHVASSKEKSEEEKQAEERIKKHHDEIIEIVKAEAQKVGSIPAVKLTWMPPDSQMNKLHFDALFSYAVIKHQWDKLKENTIAAIHKHHDNPLMVLSIIGISFHTVQDFYAHSNWYNLIQTKKIPNKTWSEMQKSEISAELQKNLDLLHTGAYPIKCCGIHETHKELNKDYRETDAIRLFNEEAYDLAKLETVAWLQGLMAEPTIIEAVTNALQYANSPELSLLTQLKGGIKNSLDQVFTDATSALPGHLNGPEGTGLDKSKIAYIPELVHACLRIAAQIRSQEKLPSPYWSAFINKDITADLSKGLCLQTAEINDPNPKHCNSNS